ncbi:MAG: sulfite reductase, partial [Gammaproteobacteria bacterium]
MNDSVTLDPFEDTKRRSRFLRGTLVAGLADHATGALAEDDTKLGKFHGFYQQDDRDIRAERRRQKLEPAYSFMVRVRMAGGVCTPAQWLVLDDLAVRYGGASLRLTTRQTFQFHGVVKRDLKATIRGINEALLDTIAACGDVNRNVMSSANPHESALQRAVWEQAAALSEHLLPRTHAYHEIWLDSERIAGGEAEAEPLYGATYLPRKF